MNMNKHYYYRVISKLHQQFFPISTRCYLILINLVYLFESLIIQTDCDYFAKTQRLWSLTLNIPIKNGHTTHCPCWWIMGCLLTLSIMQQKQVNIEGEECILPWPLRSHPGVCGTFPCSSCPVHQCVPQTASLSPPDPTDLPGPSGDPYAAASVSHAKTSQSYVPVTE